MLPLMIDSTWNNEFARADREPDKLESSYNLEQVSDKDLLANTRRLVGRQNQTLAALLAHLAEVEARGIHRVRACPSLYAYCLYELRCSEDAAFRRARAARVARQFPVIFQQVADGELHLTAIVLLAPHLTEENHRELLALAKHRTKREILRIVRALAPEPSVPDRIEPLGPEHVGIPMPSAPTWRGFLASLAPAVRELRLGDRPKDWIERASDAGAEPDCQDAYSKPAHGSQAARSEPIPEVPAWSQAQRYRVQFTASQEYADLLERARELLSHAVPDRSLEEVHLRALRLLVERLETRRYGARRPKQPAEALEASPSPSSPPEAPETPDSPETPEALEAQPRTRQSKKRAQLPRRRGSASVRREVRDRDGAQCAYVDERGQRCRETRLLELHHRLAHAQGGEAVADNLTLYCQAHNALAAEQDFGREFIETRRTKAKVERCQRAPPPPRHQ